MSAGIRYRIVTRSSGRRVRIGCFSGKIVESKELPRVRTKGRLSRRLTNKRNKLGIRRRT